MKRFLISFFAVVIIGAVSATNYCTKTCWGQQNIGCNHNKQFAGACGSNPKMVTMTNSLKKVLIDGHNAKRNFIAGGGDRKHKPACRMATIDWDDELAYLASLNVRQCSMNHDPCHSTDAFEYAGQSLSWSGKTAPANFNDAEELQNAIEGWYAEVQYSSQANIDKFPRSGGQFAHFTVMVAERNIRLGCAAVTYTGGYEQYLIACNYATTNPTDNRIYESCSKAGMKCEAGTNPQYPNLCSPAEHYDVNNIFNF